jgi:hypothetical protein
MHSTTIKPVLALFIAAGVTTGIWLVIRDGFRREQSEFLSRHRETIMAREREWARERAQRELDWHTKARERTHRQAQELETALGGPAAAAARNPDLGIGASMERVAQACAPRGTRVRVRVDRFTEFTLVLELASPLHEAALAELAHCILAYSATYVDRLQFSLRGNVLAQLDRRAIESVSDWSQINPGDVQRLLAIPNIENRTADFTSEDRESLPESDEDAASNQTPEDKVQDEAFERFQASMTAANKRFQSALKLQFQALEQIDVGQREDLAANHGMLQQAETLAAQARPVLENPSGEYRSILLAARLDSAYVNSAARTVAQRYDSMRTATAEVFNQLSNHRRSADALLVSLARHFGDWSYDSQQRGIKYTAAGTQDLSAAWDRHEQDSSALNAAIQRWSDLLKNSAPTNQRKPR